MVHRHQGGYDFDVFLPSPVRRSDNLTRYTPMNKTIVPSSMQPRRSNTNNTQKTTSPNTIFDPKAPLFRMVYPSGRYIDLSASVSIPPEDVSKLKVLLARRNMHCIVYRGTRTLDQLFQEAQSKHIRNEDESIVFFAWSILSDSFVIAIDNAPEGSSRVITEKDGIKEVDQRSWQSFQDSPVFRDILQPVIGTDLIVVFHQPTTTMNKKPPQKQPQNQQVNVANSWAST
jgi:hypothetical protein